MKMKRVRNVFVATVLTCSMIAVPVFAEPNTQSLEDQKKEAENEVSGLQSQLSTLLSKMTNLQSQLITKGEEINEAGKRLEEAQTKEKQQQEDMKLRIKYMYEEGNGSAVERILASGSISEMLSQAEYVQKIHSYDRDMMNKYIETIDEVKDLKAGLEEDMNKLEDMQSQYQTQKTELNYTIDTKSAEVSNLGAQIQEAAIKAAEEEAERQRVAAQQQNSNNPNNGDTAVNPSTPSTPDNVGPSIPPSTPKPPTGGGSSSGNVSAAQTIVNAARTQIGVPYVWGGSTPNVGFDCSGLTQWSHAQAGIYIGRVDTAQLAGGVQVSDPQPGDIVWSPGHVAIYIGNGQMIEAPEPGTTVRISAVRGNVFVRYW